MTLIMPPGEEIISPKDGDADSGCFAESCEDGKDGGLCNLKDGCLTPDLKRQQDVQDLSPPSPDPGSRHDGDGGCGEDDLAMSDPDDSDGSPGGTLDKTPPSGRSLTYPLVRDECASRGDSIPHNVNTEIISLSEGSSLPESPHIDGAVATAPPPPDCGSGDGATQEASAVGTAVVAPVSPRPRSSSPTYRSSSHEGSPAPGPDPLISEDVITREASNEGKSTKNKFEVVFKTRMPEKDVRPSSFTVTDTSDSDQSVSVGSHSSSHVINETSDCNRGTCEVISSNTLLNDSDCKIKHASICEQSDYTSDILLSESKLDDNNSETVTGSDDNNGEGGIQAAKQKIITMRQNFLFSLATSETCDIQQPQVVKCVSVGSTKRESVSDVSQTAADALLRVQEGALNEEEDDKQREAVGASQGAWQHHATSVVVTTTTAPSSDSNRKSSLENWTRELQARRGPLTGVHHRENVIGSEGGSRRASQCSEGTGVGSSVGSHDTNNVTSLRLSSCGGATSAARPLSSSRDSSNLSQDRCDIPDGDELQRRLDDPVNSDVACYATDHRGLTPSLVSHEGKEQKGRHGIIDQGRSPDNSQQDKDSDAYTEHSLQLVSSAVDHQKRGGGCISSSSNTCGQHHGDITSSQPSRLTLTQPPQSAAAAVLPPTRAHHYVAPPHEPGARDSTSDNQCLHAPISTNVTPYINQEFYQRPPPPLFAATTEDTTSRSATTSPTGSPNTDSILSSRDPLSKCGLVIALTGDPVGVDIRIVKNTDGKLVKVQDERPIRYLESQIENSSCVPKISERRQSNEFTENKEEFRSVKRPYIKDLDRGKLSSYENYIESDEGNSDVSCVGLLNFDKTGESDSDVEYNEQRKRRLSEACKDIARAFDALPTPQEENTLNSPLKVCKVPINFREKTPRKYKDQEIEACLSDDSEVQEQIKHRLIRVRSCNSPASEDDRRNSVYDNFCTEDSSCECGQCLTSDADEDTAMSKAPYLAKPTKKAGKKDITSDCEDDGFRTDVGDGCRTDEFDPISSGDDDNDYDDDYCQTEDCGDDCDYCSGDDAEDEQDKEDMTCYYCRNAPSITAGCKHPGVITNGILRSYGSHDRNNDRSGEKYRVTRQRPLVLQAAIQRRRLSRRGLVAIRESSITSDENISEEESYDGSNCDISSSWKFGLHQDIPSSRSSTLKSVKSEISTSSAPMERARISAKEKSNSLPMDMTRSLSGVEALRQQADSNLLRYPSTSEEESGSVRSLGLRLPPRPPRGTKVRTLPSSSPPTSLGSAHSSATHLQSLTTITPRPCMGLQCLQQRSPNTPKNLHASGLPVVPRTQVAPRSPSNPNPPYGFPIVDGNALLCPSSPSLPGRSTPSPVNVSNTSTAEGRAPSSPRVSSRAGALVTRNFSISDDESSGRWTGGRRHVTITRHESVYKEVAEHGYVLPPGSPVDPYWLTWKLGVLQKTVEDVSGRLEDAEKTVATWGPIPQDSNLADQHAHNVRKFREGLADLQRGVDDVNDQAARFSAHNVPLTPNNSAKLHDLNNRWKTLETTVNDRWRQVLGRSREVTPLTPAQLASSVAPPWERATTSNKVPYYINHEQESTHWDHPLMMEMLDELTEFNHIKFSAYRTATKLRVLQKKLALDHAKMQMATDLFDEHGLRGQNDRLIDVNDMVVVLSALYANISADHPEINTTVAMDLCLNWLLNVYDSQRTGQMRVLSFKIGLVCLCRGHLEEKYRYMFRLIADPNRMVDQRKLGLLLHDCVQVPRQLGEVAAFGGSNIEPSVRSCFTKAGKDRETVEDHGFPVEAVHFLSWVQQEPQSLVWLAVLHRVAASESIQHQVKCNICKTYPIIGLRYRCLKCLSFDMCQRCFFDGRSGKSHKVTHPMHEYCTATTAGEDVKDFTKALKNKFKSKRSLQKHTKKGYLPVQTVLEGDALESPSPSPQHNVTSQDMHSRLEAYASRLAEVELRTNSNSTPDSEDEHGLIAQYCQSLSSSDAPLPVPRSPIQIMAAVDADQKDELEQMIRDLEDENRVLQAEYDRLKSQQPIGSPPDDLTNQRSETEMLAEAKLLRQHKGRLEARMGILEEHNRQLEAQLHRLRQLLGEPGGLSSPNKSGTLQTKSVTASQLAMDSPAKINGHSNQGGPSSAYEGLEYMSEYVRPPPPPMGSVAHVGNLFSRAAPYRSNQGWRPGEGGWQPSSHHEQPRAGERLA